MVDGVNNSGGSTKAGYFVTLRLQNEKTGKVQTYYLPRGASIYLNDKNHILGSKNNTFTITGNDNQEAFNAWGVFLKAADANHDGYIDEYDNNPQFQKELTKNNNFNVKDAVLQNGHAQATFNLKDGSEYYIHIANDNGIDPDAPKTPKGFHGITLCNNDTQNVFEVFIPIGYKLDMPENNRFDKTYGPDGKTVSIMLHGSDKDLADLWKLLGKSDRNKDRMVTAAEIEAYNKAHPNSPYKFSKVKK